jgi:hypothetical protein
MAVLADRRRMNTPKPSEFSVGVWREQRSRTSSADDPACRRNLPQSARSEVDQARTAKAVTSASTSPSAYLRPPLPQAALHGLAGDVARVLSTETGADPGGVLLVFLTMLGNAVGPEPHLIFGSDRQSARLFVVIVGDAATGGKGTILSVVEMLFAEADPVWYHRIRIGLQSPQAMIEQVADGPQGDGRLLIVEPEFARLVSRIFSSGTEFSAQLRNAYDGRTLENTTRSRNNGRPTLRASHAHISLIGQITPEELLKLHGKLKGAGGLETRILFSLVARRAEINPFSPASPEREVLVDRLRMVIESSRTHVIERTDAISQFLCLERGIQPSVKLPVTLAIREGWASIESRLPVVGPDFRAMVRRAETHVIRMALLFAIADGSSVVSQNHVDAALALWTYCAQSAERIFGTPIGGLAPKVDPNRRGQLFEFLYRESRWVSRMQIVNGLFAGNVPKADVDATITSLLDDGIIEQRRVPTKGRSRTEYRVVEPSEDLLS